MNVIFLAINNIHEHEDSEFLGYEMLISSLKACDVEADILHIEYKHEREDMRPYVEGVDWKNVDMVGVNCMFPTYRFINQILEYIRGINPAIHVTIGGALPSVAYEDTFSMIPLADSVIMGEGEHTICELYFLIKNKGSLSTCKGLAYRDKGNIVVNSPRELICNLDSLPFASRVMLEREKHQFARIQSSRGCEGHCAFCSESKFMRDEKGACWRGRSPENIVDEIEQIYEKYNLDSFIFCDSSFEDPIEYGNERMLKIAQEIKKRGLHIFFRVLFRSESVAKMPDEILQELKSAGLFHVFLGVESGCESTLRLFRKRASVQDNCLAIKKIRDNKINLTTGFIMFHPYTTREEIFENEKFIVDNNLQFSAYSFVSKMAVHKGTFIFERAKNDGLIRDDYSISNPFEYYFVDGSMQNKIELLQKCFSILNREKEKELVSLLTYLEDEFRKTEIRSFNVDEFFDEISGIKKVIGERQLDIFRYVIYETEISEEELGRKTAELCDLVREKRVALNELHKAWLRRKILLRIR